MPLKRDWSGTPRHRALAAHRHVPQLQRDVGAVEVPAVLHPARADADRPNQKAPGLSRSDPKPRERRWCSALPRVIRPPALYAEHGGAICVLVVVYDE